jgi:hypothetical protein
MFDAIVYVDTSEVRDGALEELKAGMKELVDFVEASQPRIVAYNIYFSDDGTRMTVVHVHPDSASLEYHMNVGGALSFASSRNSSRCQRSTSTASRARSC